jgi:hypothetical protein
MRPGDRLIKDSSSVITRGFDWTAYLAALGSGVLISSSTYAVSPAGLTMAAPGIVTGSLKTVVTLSAGVEGALYTLTNQIVTSTGVTEERSITVRVRQL